MYNDQQLPAVSHSARTGVAKIPSGELAGEMTAF